MPAHTVPCFIPKYDGSGFNKVNCPLWDREFIGLDKDADLITASFHALPTEVLTIIVFERFDGEQFVPYCTAVERTSMLLNGHDTGYNSLLNIIKTLFRSVELKMPI